MQPVDHGPQIGGFSGGLQWVNPGCDEGRIPRGALVSHGKCVHFAEFSVCTAELWRIRSGLKALMEPRCFRLPTQTVDIRIHLRNHRPGHHRCGKERSSRDPHAGTSSWGMDGRPLSNISISARIIALHTTYCLSLFLSFFVFSFFLPTCLTSTETL